MKSDKIGFIGLGKLGLPVAICIDYKGFDILGYDINPDYNSNTKPIDVFYTQEADIDGQGTLTQKIKDSNVKFTNTMHEVIKESDIIFVAIQTPHEQLYSGSTRIPETRKDFNYTYLIKAIESISKSVNELKVRKIISIISTVLPTTLRTYIFPVLSPYIDLCYNPFFIAMGTTARDFLYPEFILLGFENEDAKIKMLDFYKEITNSSIYCTTIENAELIKVTYNTMISTKIAFVNNVMEMCDKLPNTNIDVVTDAIKLSNRRLISTMYLNGGMGDGGGCHPRDNIALSWLSRKLNISMNFYDMIMIGREKQTEYLANIVQKKFNETKLDIIILGKSFKAETNLIDGSPSILLKNILIEKGLSIKIYDPHIDDETIEMIKAIYFIGTKHKIFKTYKFPKGSIIIDPHRYISKTEDIDIYKVGVYEK